MNKAEVAKLLTVASTIDNRKVEPETVEGWFMVLSDLDFGIALESMQLHFRESTQYLLPAHIRGNVRRVLDTREREARRNFWDTEVSKSIEARLAEPPQCQHGLLIAKCMDCILRIEEVNV